MIMILYLLNYIRLKNNILLAITEIFIKTKTGKK